MDDQQRNEGLKRENIYWKYKFLNIKTNPEYITNTISVHYSFMIDKCFCLIQFGTQLLH